MASPPKGQEQPKSQSVNLETLVEVAVIAIAVTVVIVFARKRI